MKKAILALAKATIMSRRPSPATPRHDGTLIVMGNGPSLRQTLDQSPDLLASGDLLAVNFAANTDEFFRLQPALYVLADPHFFERRDSDPNVARLWQNLEAVDWPMTLWLPARRRKEAVALALPASVKLKFFNMTPADGSSGLLHRLFDVGLCMPRPRNVLIPSIMAGIREGYRRIILVGADHTWTRTLSVDNDNHVISIQPHFYKDSDKELKRVHTEYQGLHLHDVLGSMTIAFRSYFDVKAYADSRGIEILNATPGSFIDAFPRLKSISNYDLRDPNY